jgi:hypothetical protein
MNRPHLRHLNSMLEPVSAIIEEPISTSPQPQLPDTTP